MRSRADPPVWPLLLLAALVLLALSAMLFAAAPLQRFRLHEPVVERVFACRTLTDARALVDLAAAGGLERAQAAAQQAMAEGRCGVGAALLTYTGLAHRVEHDGHLYSVYAARVGEAVTVYVLLVDWTHEGAA